MKKNSVTAIKDYAIITFGLLLFTMGWMVFLLPAEITGGGISGVGAVLYYATKIPVSATYLSVNVLLVLIAIRILGASFGIKLFTAFSCFLHFLPFFREL